MRGNHFIHFETGTRNIKKVFSVLDGNGKHKRLFFCSKRQELEDPNFIPVQGDENGKCEYFCNKDMKFNIL